MAYTAKGSMLLISIRVVKSRDYLYNFILSFHIYETICTNLLPDDDVPDQMKNSV